MQLRRILRTVVIATAAAACQAELRGPEITDCPGGFCGPDIVAPGAFCAPCADDSDCAAEGSFCVAIGGGKACGAVPSEDLACPDPSMALSEFFDESEEGALTFVGYQCVPANDQCAAPRASLVEAGAAVVLNESYYNSPSTDVGSFLELKGAPGLSLTGYRIAIFNSSNTSTATIDLSGQVIPGSGYFVIAQDTTVPNANLVNVNANLVNTAGSLRLELNGQVVDALSYGSLATPLGEGTAAPTTSGAAVEGLARFPDGQDTNNNATDFAIQATTPGASNGGTPPPPPPPPADPILNEIYYNSPSTDVGSFLELKGAPGASLNGFLVNIFGTSGTSTATIDLSGQSIPSSGYFVIAQDTTVSGANLVNLNANLVNTAGSLRLEKSGVVVDALSYGSPSVVLGEGSSAPTTSGNAVEGLSRIPDGQDSGNNAADFAVAGTTPGAANNGSTPPPPPPPPPTTKKVLFDRTKFEDAGDADWRIDGGYSQWAVELRAAGYIVDELVGGTVDAADLSGYSVFVIPEPQSPFSDTERQVILDFVNAGGGLFLIGDHRISDRNNDGWDSPEVFNGWDNSSPSNPSQNLRKSLDGDVLFGIEFSFASSFNSPVFTVTPLTTHPALTGVTSSGVYVGTHVVKLATSAVSLLGTGGKAYLIVNSVGSGRVAAYGDSSAFSDGSFSGNQSSSNNNWTKLSNARLAKNLVSWLAKDL